MHKIYSKLMGFDVFEFTMCGDIDTVCYIYKDGSIIINWSYYGYGQNYGSWCGDGCGTGGSQSGDGETFDSYTTMKPQHQFALK